MNNSDNNHTIKQTLADQTVQKLRSFLMENDYKIGDFLPKETEFAEMLNVSRPVLREALSRFRLLGIIESKKKQGMILRNPDIFGGLELVLETNIVGLDIRKDLFELRLIMEVGLADHLFARKTWDDVYCLREIVKKENESGNMEELINCDIEFHSMLYKMSGNDSLQKFQRLLRPIFFSYSPRPKNWKGTDIVSHSGLLHIIENGNPDAFRLAMRQHLYRHYENID